MSGIRIPTVVSLSSSKVFTYILRGLVLNSQCRNLGCLVDLLELPVHLAHGMVREQAVKVSYCQSN